MQRHLSFAVCGWIFAGAAIAAPWQRIDNPAPVTGADGLPHAASCSAYPGTDPTFRFWTRKGASKNLVVYFEGGGACWDDLTCTFPVAPGLPPEVPQFYVPEVPKIAGPRSADGLFDTSRADNPVRDWNMVYIPYCTGDVHLGSATRTYNNYGHPVYPLPSQFEIRHRGFDNFMVVLDWITKNVAAPRQVLVTGASAGGYGASANFPWIAKQFPDAKLSVLADASQGVTTANFDAGLPGRGSWSPQLAPWVFGNDPLAVPSGELLRRGAQAYPAGRFSQYTNVQDSTQAGFYGLMKAYYGPGGSCPDTTADWNQQMLARLGSFATTLPNYRYYTAPGSDHTILRSATFYADQGTGTIFSDWLAQLLDRRPNGGPWVNAACADCLVPLPCP